MSPASAVAAPLEVAQYRDSPLPQGVGERRAFTLPQLLSHLKHDGSGVGDQNGIVSVEGVQARAVVSGKVKHLGAGLAKQGDEKSVFFSSAIRIGRAVIT